ncbi:TatD family hydrolase [Murdochiella massiliensis]|uniref:TatD family hydrolase n=1 Tax=Murdochiella massiliensis TaxID=1673723 RepID=UPI00096ACF2D|nr:TatD family hydrolase [Murdochiella massiliensis]
MTNSNIPQRLQRLALLLQETGIQKLNLSRVLVLGLGGVGSSCVEALARGGIGHLALLDGDVVEESNINRQAIAFTSTVGRTKTEVMREMVLAINPDCDVDARKQFLTRENTADVLDSFAKPDVVLDCIDTVSQKLEIAEWCAYRQIPLLSAMGAANKRDPMALRFSPVEKTYNCPLSKVMRRECRKRGISQLEVIFSTEPPFSPQSLRTASVTKTGTRPAKAETLGSMSYMPPIMGQMMAGKVICRLAGLEEMPEPPRKKHADEWTPKEGRLKEKIIEKQPVEERAIEGTSTEKRKKRDVPENLYLLDTHAHWDFLPPDCRGEAIRILDKAHIRLVAQTVLPSDFLALIKEKENTTKADHNTKSWPILSLGFHPWWVDTPEKNRRELAFFAEALSGTHFIGEVGLDFSEKRLLQASVQEQQAVLRQIFRLVREKAVESGTSYVFSFHAVRSLTPLLDLYEEANLVLPNVVPIIHRFAGTSDELTRLIRLGGLLSVHPAMLRTKRGCAYVKQVPADRLLLETDLPEKPVSAEQNISTSSSEDGAERENTINDAERANTINDVEQANTINDVDRENSMNRSAQQEEHRSVASTFAEEVKNSLSKTLARLSDLRGEEMAETIEKTQRKLYGWPEEQ